MIVDYLDIVRVAVFESENQAPWAVDSHRPLPLAIANQWMQPDRLERRDVVQGPGDVQYLQPRHPFGHIQPAELRFVLQSKAFGGAIGVARDHNDPRAMRCMSCQAWHA